jgi:hypothetical protein
MKSPLRHVNLSTGQARESCVVKHNSSYTIGDSRARLRTEAVALDNCAELYLSENSSRLESDLDSSLTCGWQSYNSEHTSSYRQWCHIYVFLIHVYEFLMHFMIF